MNGSFQPWHLRCTPQQNRGKGCTTFSCAHQLLLQKFALSTSASPASSHGRTDVLVGHVQVLEAALSARKYSARLEVYRTLAENHTLPEVRPSAARHIANSEA